MGTLVATVIISNLTSSLQPHLHSFKCFFGFCPVFVFPQTVQHDLKLLSILVNLIENLMQFRHFVHQVSEF